VRGRRTVGSAALVGGPQVTTTRDAALALMHEFAPDLLPPSERARDWHRLPVGVADTPRASAVGPVAVDGSYGTVSLDEANGSADLWRRRIFRLRETINLTSAAEDYVIGSGLLTRGGKLLLYAKSGMGKTTLMDHLAAALASGQPFLGRFAVDRPYRVLMVQGEISEPELATHGQDLLTTYADTAAADNLVFWLDTQLKLPSEEDQLIEVVREYGSEIVILDPFINFFEGESTDKDVQVARLTSTLDRLLENPSLDVQAVAVIHHANVTSLRTAGSYKFEAWPSTILKLEQVAGVPTDRYLCFEKIRAPGSDLREKMQIRLGDEGYVPVDIDERAMQPVGVTLVLNLLREAGGQLSRQEVIARMMARANVSARSVTTYLGQGLELGLITSHKVGKETIYRLADLDPATAAAAAAVLAR
jgi:energy-coupling factor transporter ATP-binding protein EcfA2